MDLIQFIQPEQMLLVASCYCLGSVIKNSTFVENHYIPIILMGFAIAFNLLISGLCATSILEGIIIAFVSVGINSSVRQIEKFNIIIRKS